MKKNLFFLVSLIIPLLFSCKEDNPAPSKTKTELISQGTWKFSSATANGTDVSNQDPPFAPCRKDNILTFQASGNGSVAEGATSCSPSEASTFTWNFASNETMLHVSTSLFPGATNDFTIEALTETQLIVNIPYSPPIGPIIMIRVIFIH
jgi:hypothetical protein